MPVLHTLLRLGVPLLAAAVLPAAAPLAAVALPTVPAPLAAAADPAAAAPPVAAAGPVAAAPSASAEEPGWRAEPVSGSGGSAVRPYFYLAGPPGTVLEDRLALVNTTGQEHTVTLRGADAHNTPGGALAVRPARESSDAGSWISFGAGSTVKLPPRTRAVVPFTVTVPPASPPGDHPAAVVATEAGREVGVRVHLRVSGPALAALTVEDVAVRGRGAGRVVSYTLVNRGNVTLAPRLAIRAEGRFGEVAGRAPRAVPVELLPGRRVALTEPWPGAPVLDRVELTLTVTAPGGARATAAASVWCLPWGITGRTGAGLLALGGATPAALVLVRIRRSRRARREPADASAPAPVRTPAPDHELTGASR
ncbi:COG1470 family protein [Streptomyces goshikiensis]|uniref:COG1470 family protein n=1 Tax=Streptomyces goshikiensis TaxID=1942 RepID=UPI003320D559